MKANLYLEKEKPFVSVVPEKLSDGSEAWNLVIGDRTIPCVSEKHADLFFDSVVKLFQHCTNEAVVVL